ncbi:MAG: nucleotidyltransferase family protein [Fimbriimonadaceae bacterium]
MGSSVDAFKLRTEGGQMLRQNEISKYLCNSTQTLRDVLALINENNAGIALLVDENHQLMRAITDGDIRRAILDGVSVDSTIEALGLTVNGRKPTVAHENDTPADMRSLMLKNGVRQLPLVDKDFKVVDLVIIADLLQDHEPPVNAVVMAGGFGTRLRPLTEELPKPMLPVGDRPLLERIVSQLSTAGIFGVSVTTHFMPEVIEQHFGDGSHFGVNMNYVHEETPLGTAGALRMLPKPEGPVLVMNGDILTSIDFRNMTKFHNEHESDLTLAVRPYEVYVPYGVVETEGQNLRKLVEKPTYTHFVNAGIYLLSPSAFEYLGTEGRLDMTQLIDRLIKSGRNVVTFPVTEYWLDIGHMDDYKRAQRDAAEGLV